MANLLRLIVELAEDADARASFRDDPDAALADFEDLCGEDVAAVVDVARIQVDPKIAERLTDVLRASSGAQRPFDAAVAAMLSLCDAVEGPAVVNLLGQSYVPTDHEVPDRPPGLDRPVHLWAVGPSEESASEDGPGSASHAPLAPVPDPPGGFDFSILELVSLPEGIPEAGIEPGAEATIVAVVEEPERSYEIEVSGPDGERLYLGVVPTSKVAPRR